MLSFGACGSFEGWFRFSSLLRVQIGGHFRPVDMNTELHSVWAFEWYFGGGDMGCGWGEVVVWGIAEQSKKSYYIILAFFFVDILGFRQTY